jgi:glutathione S-transferase
MSKRRTTLTERVKRAEQRAQIEQARLVKFRLADAGLPHLAAWRDRIAERPSAAV